MHPVATFPPDSIAPPHPRTGTVTITHHHHHRHTHQHPPTPPPKHPPACVLLPPCPSSVGPSGHPSWGQQAAGTPSHHWQQPGPAWPDPQHPQAQPPASGSQAGRHLHAPVVRWGAGGRSSDRNGSSSSGCSVSSSSSGGGGSSRCIRYDWQAAGAASVQLMGHTFRKNALSAAMSARQALAQLHHHHYHH